MPYTSQYYNNYDIIDSCIRPTLYDAVIQFMIPILIANLTLWLICLLNRLIFRSNWKQLEFFCSIICGYCLLLYHFRNDHLFMLSFVTVSLLLVNLLISFLLQQTKYHIILVWLYSFLMITLNETIIFCYDQKFEKLRPNLMLIAMKSISYYHEVKIETKDKESCSFWKQNLKLMAYQCHPCSLILGVWHPHNHHLSYRNLLYNIGFLLTSSILSITFLLCSTCLIEQYLENILFESVFSWLYWFVPETIVKPFELLLLAYSTAIQFHFSHYFICFAAQSIFNLWDIRYKSYQSV